MNYMNSSRPYVIQERLKRELAKYGFAPRDRAKVGSQEGEVTICSVDGPFPNLYLEDDNLVDLHGPFKPEELERA